MSGTYALPSPSSRVTSSFTDHTERTPPSTQPGTDYGVNLGTACYAPSSGKVTATRTGNGPATDGQGRYISIRLDDGRETRALHLHRVDVSVGQRVSRGQKIGETGASGYGSDYYYGPHIHQTLWKGAAWSTPEIDFENHTGEPPTEDETEDEEMAMHGCWYTRASDGEIVYMIFNEGSGWWVIHTGGGGTYNNPLAQAWHTDQWVPVTESHAHAMQRALDAVAGVTGVPQLSAVNVEEP